MSSSPRQTLAALFAARLTENGTPVEYHERIISAALDRPTLPLLVVWCHPDPDMGTDAAVVVLDDEDIAAAPMIAGIADGDFWPSREVLCAINDGRLQLAVRTS